MGNHIRHFAIHADDVERARNFYAAVFDWRFEPWGPPDLDAMLAKISEHGGHLLAPPFHIHGVGRLSYFEDTERNRVGVMQYDPGYAF